MFTPKKSALRIVMKNLKNKLNMAYANIKFAMANNSGAAMWEYLLIIAVVIIIGGVLLNSIDDSIGGIWDRLMGQLEDLFALTD